MVGLPAVSLFKFACVAQFGNEALLAVEVPGGFGWCGLADAPALGVVAVFRAVAQVVFDFDQPVCCVVAVGAGLATHGLGLQVAVGVVAQADLVGGIAPLQQLVFWVVGPGSRLVGAAGAVACCVIGVGLHGQAGLQGCGWGGAGEVACLVVGAGEVSGLGAALGGLACDIKVIYLDQSKKFLSNA